MPQPIMIRPANSTDAAQLTGLLTELGYPDNTVEDVEQRLAFWAADQYCTVLAAEQGDQLVGVAAVAAIPYLERPGRWGRLVALVVTDRCRGQGVGRRLVTAAEDTARAQGCVSMEVSSARSRVAAHAFYRDLGYEDWCDRGARLLKDLVPGASAATFASRS